MTANSSVSSRRTSASSSAQIKKTRCAIYTRVSTDQGLDQEFNSLDAQREASEAYIKSQAHEGWTCLRQTYDDGGYSGGSMARPALQRLLEDVKTRKLDVIVVYKVDRLTRSLADFAKLVELFDAHEVSFVSVTQSFNTTSSMGRLTLNVLLSFAQFEREVTGERIRDKFAASKKKGMWMGGNVPLGYRLKDRKLIIEQSEAETVRRTFNLYLEVRSLPRLAARLAELGVVSRTRRYGDRLIGGQAFRTGALSHLLANRVYVGEVRHHDRVYPGEHEPILSRELFEAVQSQLAGRLNRKSNVTHKSRALLQGLLFDSKGNRMIPVHSKKSGLRYPYYQSWVLNHGQKERAGVVSRVPAHEIEQAVLDGVNLGRDAGHDTVVSIVERIEVLEDELSLTLRQGATTDSTEDAGPSDNQLSIRWNKQAQTRKRELIPTARNEASSRPMRPEVRSRLVKSIAQGRIWLDELIASKDQTTNSLAQQHGLSERSIRSTINLGLLAPDIVETAIDGRLSRGITVTQMTGLPLDWQEQKRVLGLV